MRIVASTFAAAAEADTRLDRASRFRTGDSMFLRSAVVARPGETRRRIGAVLHEVESLVANLQALDQLEEHLEARPIDLVVVDLAYAPQASTAWVKAVLQRPDPPEILIIGLEDDPEKRASYFAAGCFGVLPANVGDEVFRESFKTLAERRLREAQSGLREIPDEDYCLGDYATNSPAMRDFLKSARRIASRNVTTLLLGETGVGKGLLARSLHNEGSRASGPFVAVNCGALTESLLESELFGHERGAFTGADRARRGYFELAHGGTLFLDEVAELPLHLQTKLLRVIEDRTVRPLGSEKTIAVDVRLLAATNRDLELEVKEQRFREDLYYRLNVITLRLPSLTERRQDIAEIAQSYVEHYRTLTGSDVKGVSSDAQRALLAYHWPGNIREVSNAIERAVIMATGAEIQVVDLPITIQEFAPALSPTPAPDDIKRADTDWLNRPWTEVRRQVLEEAELRYLSSLLRETAGRVGETAKRAGMDPRSLHQKLKKYGLRKESFRA